MTSIDSPEPRRRRISTAIVVTLTGGFAAFLLIAGVRGLAAGGHADSYAGLLLGGLALALFVPHFLGLASDDDDADDDDEEKAQPAAPIVTVIATVLVIGVGYFVSREWHGQAPLDALVRQSPFFALCAIRIAVWAVARRRDGDGETVR